MSRPPITYRWHLRLVSFAVDRAATQSVGLRSVLLGYAATPDLGIHERTLETVRRLVNVEIERVADASACDSLDQVYPQLYAIAARFGWTETERVIMALAVLLNLNADWHHLASNLILRRDHVPHLLSKMTGVDIAAMWDPAHTVSSLRESGLVRFETRDPVAGMPLPEWIKPLQGLDEEALATSGGWRWFIEKINEGGPRMPPVARLPKRH